MYGLVDTERGSLLTNGVANNILQKYKRELPSFFSSENSLSTSVRVGVRYTLSSSDPTCGMGMMLYKRELHPSFPFLASEDAFFSLICRKKILEQ